MRIDLNCDLGEGYGPWTMGDDDAMLDVVTTANVACGFHAGDPTIMARTVATALAKGVAIGAHPGFADLQGFGRRVIPGLSLAEIERLVAYQVGALMGIAALGGHRVTHVKTHGSLGNMANDDEALALAVARAVAAVDRALVLVVMPGLPTERAAQALGLAAAREIYADRTYAESGNLAPRSNPGAVIHDADLAARRVVRMIEEGAVTTEGGRRIPAGIDTVCVHGDTPGAVAMARAVRAAVEAAGITVAPFARRP